MKEVNFFGNAGKQGVNIMKDTEKAIITLGSLILVSLVLGKAVNFFRGK